MKRFILILSVLFPLIPVFGESSVKSLDFSDIRLIREEGHVHLRFTLFAGKKSIGSDYTLLLTPVFVKGGERCELSPVLIHGHRASISSGRNDLTLEGNQTPFIVKAGESVSYESSTSYESWMEGSDLLVEGIRMGCCSSDEVTIGTVASNILRGEVKTHTEIVAVPVKEVVVESTGDGLARKYPFIAPLSEFEQARQTPDGVFDYDMPLNLGKGLTEGKQKDVERFINGTREGSISIYFRQGSNSVDRTFENNNKALVELISSVRAIQSSADSKIARIIIAGFASPEGSISLNERLAWNRAVAIKDFLISNSGIDSETIRIYNGSVDWSGLRTLVLNSDLYDKQRIADIHRYRPFVDSRNERGRLGELMKLSGGDSYRYMQRHFFPKLRQAAYIKVYYDNK